MPERIDRCIVNNFSYSKLRYPQKHGDILGLSQTSSTASPTPTLFNMQPGRPMIQYATSPNPSIESTTAASLHAFAEACANGNIDTVAILATGDDHYPNTQHYLNHGLLSSINL